MTAANMNPNQEVKLSNTAAERDLNDSLAEIYSIIITLDGLEKAYIKDSIPEGEYADICSRLLKQYKSNLSDETVAREFVDLETFKREWDACSPPIMRMTSIIDRAIPDRVPPSNRTPPRQPPRYNRRSFFLTPLNIYTPPFLRAFCPLSVRLPDPARN
jgi:ESCRT-I complex subunit VPS28